ncbi:MAG TPA: NifU family protein [Acidimicrobiales bacterium]|nr:NifU family protein [Acidimicrobiales bacterium]
MPDEDEPRTDGPGAGSAPALTITPDALSVVLEARSSEADAERLALWVEVTGARQGSYTYDIYFQAAADAAAQDHVTTSGDLTVVVPESSVARIVGARLDYSGDSGDDEGGLVILNPNTPPSGNSATRPNGDLSGEVAQRVLAVLEQQVNPSIAMHGGRADLVAVEEGVAYLRLSGGCQGCGLATVTLSQGIEVALKDSVPEIVSVVDVTDHASGTNPFYEPAKK